ncbi:related to BEM2 - GTPase-activating protein [Pseudozyma flocculosa]|uniref:Related to BEM2 - GTPase-activating protein n=1 Tax=Pseudozyma flocculosa TaxID=84751 RepID=A0A5C3EUR1_9BASI|nr:related to BEM2 - GTPase-activating protein [Pseudozyma flocculosa]
MTPPFGSLQNPQTAGQQPPSQQQQQQQQQPIGRSQSAFNFLLSKAKMPFSSSSSSSTLNTSNSLSSLSGQHDDPFIDSTNHLQYHRQLQQQYPAPHGPSMASLGRSSAVPGPAATSSVPRSSTSEQHAGKTPTTAQGSSFGSRPSMSDETAVSSPTKRGFFGGMGRDRKVSNASAGKPPLASKNGYGHSPLGRGLRQDSGGSASFALYSKSQSDLHARAEFPSPTSGTTELPKMPLIYAQNTQGGDRGGQYLQSPSPAIGFSRSVDDLGSTDQPSSPYPITPNSLQEGPYHQSPTVPQHGGNWGEQGLVTGDAWRPSDMGTLASPSSYSTTGAHHARDGQARSAPGSARSDAAFQHVPLSSAPSHQAGGLWPIMPPPAPSNAAAHAMAAPTGKADSRKHSRKASKLNNLGSGREAATTHGKGAVAGTLAASLGLASIGSVPPGTTSPNTRQNSEHAGEPVPLPPGAVFQGFLGRNTHISLSLQQLTETDGSKGREKEKDISKGWKPYRVVLQDGKLHFYKPPSSVSDDVKALFPTTVAWGAHDRNGSGPSKASGSSYARELGIDANGLVNSGLGKNELLLATSSNKDGSSAQSSPSFGPLRYKGLPGRRTPVRGDSSTTVVLTAEPEPMAPPTAVRVNASDAWAGAGAHPALSLAEVAQAPKRWIDRIQSATLDALADEFVRATQLPESLREASASATADEVQAQTDAFAVTALVSAAASSPEVGPASLLGEISRLAAAQLERPEDNVSRSLRQRLSRLIQLSVELGVTRSRRVFEDAVSQLRSLAQRLEADAETIKALEPTPAGQARATVKDWLNPDPCTLNGTRPELEQMFAARAITGDLLLKLDPLEVAQQIQAFHANRLGALVEPSHGATALDMIDPDHHALVTTLSFDSQSSHYLTRLVLSHLVGGADAETQGTSAIFNQSGARHRASLLRHWIAIASYLLSFGDIPGWLAVVVALCSRAVTRLEQTWRYLAEGDRLLVAREWAPQLAKAAWIEGIHSQVRPILLTEGQHAFVKVEPGRTLRVLPFLGNAPAHLLRRDVQSADVGPASDPPPHGDRQEVAGKALESEALLALARDWRSTWQLDDAPIPIAAVADPIVEYQLCLQLAAQATGSVMDVSSLMARSYRLEPKALGNLQIPGPAAVAARAATAHLSQVPLLFPMPLPHLSLLDVGKIQEVATGADRKAKQISDPYATITARTLGRPGINASPFVRSSAFSPTLPFRGSRSAIFGGIYEWNPTGGPSAVGEDSAGLFRIGNELVLKPIQEPSLSVPSSPMAAKRFSQDFGRSSRPLSQVSKRSSLPASNRSSVIEVVVPVQVVVKAATLERMIDVLVMGVQHINVKGPDENAVEGAAPRRTRLSLDLESYRSTFLATYRSLCSPRELFEQLQKRFATAINASKEMALLDTYQISSQFPSWVMVNPAGSHVEPIDWEVVSRIRMGVVLTLRVWIDRFPQDFADDDALYQLVHAFLRHPGMEPLAEDPDQARLSLAIAQINGMFVQSIMSANARGEERSYALATPVYASGSIDAVDVDFDAIGCEELVDFLESIATVFFDKIVERDLLVVAELFERQALQPTGWYAARHSDSQPGDDDKPINSMYSLLDVLRTPGSSGREPTLQQRLPAAVRDALAAQSLLRGWVAIHIIERGLGVEKRQARLEKLLDAVWICRARMARLRAGDDCGGGSGITLSQESSMPFREATIGSFIESAILGSLTSSESRIFLRAWQGVALGRSGTGDSLADLFPLDVTPPMRVASSGASTPDVGWILGCLAEAATRASAPSDAADVGLIDFEQRRTVWSLIEGAVRVRPPCNSPALIDLAGARLKAMQTALSHVTWDRRAFREDAAREASQATPISPHANIRQSSSGKALAGLSRQQQEKMRRDRSALASLEATLATGPSISSRLSSMPASGDRSSGRASSPIVVGAFSGVAGTAAPNAAAPAAADKTTIRARRMTALFGRAVRPLISDKSDPQPVRTVDELMRLTPTQKPSLVAGLGGAQLAPWNNSQRPFVLHLTSEEGAKYLLQAPSQAEMSQWYTQISRIAKERAPRRPTEARKGFAGKSGAQIDREGSAVPMAVEKMFAEIEARGLREQGIYRISGAKSAIEGLRNALNKQPLDSIDLSNGEYSDVNTIAGAIKHFFRDLPEPVITFASYDAIIAAERIENHDERLSTIREIIWALPKCHFDLLRRTAEHLARVVDEGKYNLMAPHNIGLVFGTSLLNPPPGPSSIALSFGNIGKAAHIVKIIVTMHEWLFEPEPEPEVDVETGSGVEQDAATGTAAVDTSTSLLSAEPSAVREGAGPTAVDEDGDPDSLDRRNRLGGTDVTDPPSGRSTTAAQRRHTYMLGGLGLGADQLQQLRGIPDRDTSTVAASGASMQRSFSSDSEPLTPLERFDGLSPVSSSQPMARKLSSPASPLPSVPDEDASAEGLPDILLTSTERNGDPCIPAEPQAADSDDRRHNDDDAAGSDERERDDESANDDTASAIAQTGAAQSPPPDAAGALLEVNAANQPRPRAKRMRDGYRDSVFSSYSLYADCFDNLSLAAAPTAAGAQAVMSGKSNNDTDSNVGEDFD